MFVSKVSLTGLGSFSVQLFQFKTSKMQLVHQTRKHKNTRVFPPQGLESVWCAALNESSRSNCPSLCLLLVEPLLLMLLSQLLMCPLIQFGPFRTRGKRRSITVPLNVAGWCHCSIRWKIYSDHLVNGSLHISRCSRNKRFTCQLVIVAMARGSEDEL